MLLSLILLKLFERTDGKMANVISEIRKRPVIITILCIKNCLWVLKLFPSIANPMLKHYGDFFPPLYGVIVALVFISVIGIWHMKRWGVNMYIVAFFIKQLFLIATDDLSYVGIGVSAFSIIVFVIYYR